MRSCAGNCIKPPVRNWLPWVGLTIRLFAAAVWLVAGISKITDLEHFHAQVHAYKLLPGSLEAPFAYALPFVELGIGLYLALGLLVPGAAALSVVLMIVFIAAMAQAWARGLSLDCGCFAGVAREKVGPWTILRDAALGIPGLIMLVRPARFLSLDRRLLGRRDRWASRDALASR